MGVNIGQGHLFIHIILFRIFLNQYQFHEIYFLECNLNFQLNFESTHRQKINNFRLNITRKRTEKLSSVMTSWILLLFVLLISSFLLLVSATEKERDGSRGIKVETGDEDSTEKGNNHQIDFRLNEFLFLDQRNVNFMLGVDTAVRSRICPPWMITTAKTIRDELCKETRNSSLAVAMVNASLHSKLSTRIAKNE